MLFGHQNMSNNIVVYDFDSFRKMISWHPKLIQILRENELI